MQDFRIKGLKRTVALGVFIRSASLACTRKNLHHNDFRQAGSLRYLKDHLSYKDGPGGFQGLIEFLLFGLPAAAGASDFDTCCVTLSTPAPIPDHASRCAS